VSRAALTSRRYTGARGLVYRSGMTTHLRAAARLLALGLCLLLGACAAFGPPAIHLSRTEIAERAFIDRQQLDLRRVLKGMEGLELSGPDVGVQVTAERLQLAWTAKLADAPTGVPLSIYIALSGKPVLNAAGSGVDLADARIEEVRMPLIPFVSFDSKALNQSGDSFGTLPLLAFRPEELNRDGVIYQARQLSLGVFGLRVDLVPK
jgi:hypothetical protein